MASLVSSRGEESPPSICWQVFSLMQLKILFAAFAARAYFASYKLDHKVLGISISF